ncbi:MAG: methyltransferase domain-containing protein [bacterium]
MNQKDQGANADILFHGEGSTEAIKLIYKESAQFLTNKLKEKLNPGEYTLADLGSHKGAFLTDFISLLPDYNFITTAIDVNGDDLKDNQAMKKIISNLKNIPVSDKAFDVVIARYSIAWNTFEDQNKILTEIKRITKKIAIIQHQGADSDNPIPLQTASEKLFSGIIPKLKRNEFFFSTPKHIEGFMQELDLNFEKIQDRKVEGLSGVLAERFKLTDVEALETKKILEGSDYITQSAWIINF